MAKAYAITLSDASPRQVRGRVADHRP